MHQALFIFFGGVIKIINDNDTLKDVQNLMIFGTKSLKEPTKFLVKTNFKATAITSSILIELLKKIIAFQRGEFKDYSAIVRAINNQTIKNYINKGISLDQTDYNIEDMKLFKKIMNRSHIKYTIQKYGYGTVGKDFSIFFDVRDAGLLTKALENYERELSKRNVKQNKETEIDPKVKNKEDVQHQKEQDFAFSKQDMSVDTDLDGVEDRVDVNINDNRVKDIKDIDKLEAKNIGKLEKDKKPKRKESILSRINKKKSEIKQKKEKEQTLNLSKEKEKNLEINKIHNKVR